MSLLTERAYLFAVMAHHGQTRKVSNEPYVNHPRRVAEAVAEAGGTDEMIAAAYLHDVLEDTKATYLELITWFGEHVNELVVEVTDVYTPEAYPYLNRAQRKIAEAARLGRISLEARVIKRADIADNLRDIDQFPEQFQTVYQSEKDLVLKLLDEADAN